MRVSECVRLSLCERNNTLLGERERRKSAWQVHPALRKRGDWEGGESIYRERERLLAGERERENHKLLWGEREREREKKMIGGRGREEERETTGGGGESRIIGGARERERREIESD